MSMFVKKIAKTLAATLATSGLAFALVPTSAQASTTLAQGVGSAVANAATVFGNTPSDTPVTVSLILRTRNTIQLQQYINETVTPGPLYRHFLSTSEFAQRYGQSPFLIDGIVKYFQTYGIAATVYPDNLDITLNGTAGQFNKAFSVTMLNMMFGGQHFYGVRRAPQLPSNLGNPILAVLGLTNYSPFTSKTARVPQSVLAKVPANSTSSAPPTGVVTPQQMEDHYNITPLYNSGDVGQGQTLGIVTLASLNPGDAYAFWKAYNIPSSSTRVTTMNVDGGAGAPSLSAGSDETALDVEQSGAMAPGANIIVYQAPNTDYGFADAFFQAISDNHVDSLSASWGESEDAIQGAISTGQESPNYAEAFNEAYMEAAAQGISTFASAGDSGAYDASADVGSTDLSVDNPADSPYVTAAGGSTLPWSDVAGNFGNSVLGIPDSVVTQERAWGWDYLWPYYNNFGASDETSFAESMVVGGGGGYSALFREPDYQYGTPGVRFFHAVPYLTPTNNNTAWNFNPSPSVVTGLSNGGRAMPDLSLNADPFTGYNIYSGLFGGNNWSSGWGGTSFVAPQLNGIAALIDQQAGGRVGFWNPQIYRFARQFNSPFTPLNATGTSNDNIYYSGTAHTLWNPATGLGVPNVAKLAADFRR